MVDKQIYTVTEFNKKVKDYLDDNDDFKELYIEGEMSNVTYYKSGHLYFNLKDAKAQIKCAAFNYKLKRIPEDLKEGDSVKVLADVGFYEARGDFQLLARHIEKQNTLGELFVKLERLKKNMAEKGYFSPEHKKPLPKYPKNVGVVTAKTGAALQDIIKTIKKRDNSINIYVYSAKVQGVGAKEEIVKGIQTLNLIPDLDIIIAGRGGGSIEDLWAFNEECVAMAFYNSKIPIISAVGHETDVLLSDMTADVRAATPTQAVEIAIPEREKIKYELISRNKYLKAIYEKYMDYLKNELNLRRDRYHIKNFIKTLQMKNQAIIDKEARITSVLNNYINNEKNHLDIRINKIIALNPLNILKRGYSIVSKNDRTIRDIASVKVNDNISIRISNGSIKGIVTDVEEIKNSL